MLLHLEDSKFSQHYKELLDQYLSGIQVIHFFFLSMNKLPNLLIEFERMIRESFDYELGFLLLLLLFLSTHIFLFFIFNPNNRFLFESFYFFRNIN